MPAHGQLLPVGDIKQPPAPGVVHKDMLSKVTIELVIGKKDRRKERFLSDGAEKKALPKRSFEVRSPLLAFKDKKNRSTCLENLPPFWALLRVGGPKAAHNMELEDVVFPIDEIKAAGYNFPKPELIFATSATIHIAHNICAIEKGEVLTLPFLEANTT